MTSAPGTKKKTAARIHRLMEDVPLWPAAAIHLGPRTVAMLNSSTSQKPMVFRNCDFESRGTGAGMVMALPFNLPGVSRNHTRPRADLLHEIHLKIRRPVVSLP